jgi:hypothetical protein
MQSAYSSLAVLIYAFRQLNMSVRTQNEGNCLTFIITLRINYKLPNHNTMWYIRIKCGTRQVEICCQYSG